MPNQPITDLGLSISIPLFALSFSWLFQERTNKYPFIRRFASVFSNPLVENISSPDFRVMFWGFAHTICWLILSSISFYLYALSTNAITSLIIGPVFYFLAPQLISPSLTVLIFWRVPDDPRKQDATTLVAMNEKQLEKMTTTKARNLFIGGSFTALLCLFGAPILLWLSATY